MESEIIRFKRQKVRIKVIEGLHDVKDFPRHAPLKIKIEGIFHDCSNRMHAYGIILVMCNCGIKCSLDVLGLVAQQEKFAAIKERVSDDIIAFKMNLLPASPLGQDVGYKAVNDNFGAPKRWSKSVFDMI